MTAKRWQALPAFPDSPALLVASDFGPASYTIHITDLAHVWSETLDRKGILRRSLNEDTSIDLSDGDPDQWSVFLSKLKAAFDPSSADHGQTTLALAAAPSDRSSPESLMLHIQCVLPQPLKPLQWPVHLARGPSSALASELVLPLIQSHHAQARDIDGLVSQIHDKDAVIYRLVDKLESLGAGLEHVFNSLAGKRKVTRAAADDKIKGLAPFDRSAWETSTHHRSTYPDPASLVRDVFNGAASGSPTADVGISSRLNDWWKSIGTDPRAAVQRHGGDPPGPEPGTQLGDDKSVGDGDADFQVQDTPPHLRSSRQDRAGDATDDDATESEDDTSEILQHKTEPGSQSRSQVGSIGGAKESSQAPAREVSRPMALTDTDDTASDTSDAEDIPRPKGASKSRAPLGMIGGSKKPSPPRKPASPPPRQPSPSPPPAQIHDDDTASGSEDEKEEALPKPQAQAQPSRARPGGLGVIGGRPRPVDESRVEKRPHTPNDGSGETSPKSPGRREVVVGKGRGGTENAAESHPPEEKPESEDEDKRAERKRAELAKELERKAAAPAKKKRRF